MMKPENFDKLKSSYPLLFAKIKYVDCSDGWFSLLNSLSSYIESWIKNLPVEMHEQLYVVQIKSKFGGLRYYMNQSTPCMDGAIALAEDMSNNMCEECGAPGEHKVIANYYWTLCEKHNQEHIDEFEARKKK